jgi:hypothetical protein
MKNKSSKNTITIDLSSCENWNECVKVMDMIISGKVKIIINKKKKL